MSLQTIANQVAAQGRGKDTTLVHMTPNEVQGLQQLAQVHGGSLSTNPQTGLPEAGFLDDVLGTVLPIAAGFALGPAGLGLTSLGAGLTVGGITGLLKGDLGQGLMAGLGAYGGASGFGGMFGGEEAAKQAAQQTEAANTARATEFGAKSTALSGGLPTQGLTSNVANVITRPDAVNPMHSQRLLGAAAPVAQAAPAAASPWYKSPWVLGGGALALGAMGQQPEFKPPGAPTAPEYKGPYLPQEREASFGDPRATSKEHMYFDPSNPVPGYLPYPGYAEGGLTEEMQRGIEQDYGFKPMAYTPPTPNAVEAGAQGLASGIGGAMGYYNPQNMPWGGSFPASVQTAPPGYGYNAQGRWGFHIGGIQSGPNNLYYRGQPIPMAEGGLASLQGVVEMEDGSFVVDARTVSELGNGSSQAGQEFLAGLGGTPVNGAGDGVSDSIPATIDGEEQAMVARDEVVFSPDAVARLGNGDHSAGADRLYELMKRAEDARKEMDRGEDNGIAGEMVNDASIYGAT